MIKDKIKYKETYGKMGDRIEKALDYLEGLKEGDFAPGTVELDGRNLFAMHQAYETESPADHRFESHRDYIDIQFMMSGSEVIRVADIGDLTLCEEYNPGKDIMFYDASDGTDVKLRQGDFVILYPHDGHMPKLALGSPEGIRKVVIKIRIV